METLLRYLFLFEFAFGAATVMGIGVTALLERLENLPRWALRIRGVLTAIF